MVACLGLLDSINDLEVEMTDRLGDSKEREIVKSCLGPLSLSVLLNTSPTEPIESRGDSPTAKGFVQSPPLFNGPTTAGAVALS